MDLAGLPVTLLDTAGLREAQDEIEEIGIALARERAEAADLRVFLAEEGEQLDVKMRPGDIRVLPKADLRESPEGAVSGVTGQGLDDLVERISAELSRRATGAGIATRERHRDAMNRALAAIGAARQVLARGADDYDKAAEELRSAIRALESLVGRIDVENLLDEIFASFCLGK